MPLLMWLSNWNFTFNTEIFLHHIRNTGTKWHLSVPFYYYVMPLNLGSKHYLVYLCLNTSDMIGMTVNDQVIRIKIIHFITPLF